MAGKQLTTEQKFMRAVRPRLAHLTTEQDLIAAIEGTRRVIDDLSRGIPYEPITEDVAWAIEFRRPGSRGGFGVAPGPAPFGFWTNICRNDHVVGHILTISFHWFYLGAWRHRT